MVVNCPVYSGDQNLFYGAPKLVLPSEMSHFRSHIQEILRQLSLVLPLIFMINSSEFF